MEAKNYPDFVAQVSRDPLGQINRYKEQGKPVMGYTCTYVPEEIIDAMGYVPVRLLGRAQNIQQADKYLQTYCCSQIRCVLEDKLNGDYDNLEGVIFAHTCDSMQSFHDIFKRNFADMFVQNINLPSRLDSDIAYRYALAEIKRFVDILEKHSGASMTKENLNDSIALMNRNRELLDTLYTLHLSHPDEIPSVVLLHSIMASMFLDKRDINSELSDYLAQFDDNKPQDEKRKRIMLVGSINIMDDVYNLADEFGAMIADDDMCTGRRYFSTLVTEPTVDGIARRYFSRPNCAAKFRELNARMNYVKNLAVKKKIDAVVFLYLKFCDPHGFDYPDINKALESAGVRTQMIEIEQASVHSGQLRTKLQAFLEMLD